MNDWKDRSKRMQSLVLKTFSETSGAAVAAQIGASEAKVSRLKNEHLADMCNLFAAMGLRLVPADVMVVKEQMLNAMFVLAKARLDDIKSASDLVIPDEEWVPPASPSRADKGGSG